VLLGILLPNVPVCATITSCWNQHRSYQSPNGEFHLRRINIVVLSLLAASLLTGCTSNTAGGAAKGALAGAGSAMFVGALTDLIVDGHVDPYRLERNAVGGAIVGGAAGAAQGHSKDKSEQDRATKKTAAAEQVRDDQELIAEIGSNSFRGLEALVTCQHTEAYRFALKAIESDNSQFREAGYLVQALVDKDRGNDHGADKSLLEFLAITDLELDQQTVHKELDVLMGELKVERKVQGISPQC
jgi:hypothetical protein